MVYNKNLLKKKHESCECEYTRTKIDVQLKSMNEWMNEWMNESG